MAIYVANENGDWWGVNGTETTLYVFDTDKLTFDEKVAIANEWDTFDPELDDHDELDDIVANIIGEDKFEKIIWEFGTEETIQL